MAQRELTGERNQWGLQELPARAVTDSDHTLRLPLSDLQLINTPYFFFLLNTIGRIFTLALTAAMT